VVAHNHPSNNASPSDADLSHLAWLERTLEPLKITLLDSFVVTASTVTSIKTVRQQNKEREDLERSARWVREREEKSARRAANKATKFAAQQSQEVTV